MPTYNPKAIEPRWQKYWEDNQTFRVAETSTKPKFYILDMFPYPSGAGLHVGHPEGYTATDILARYRRMHGCSVLHPMGWDAFGLPAEQYAIETGTHPRATTQQNVANFRRQIKMLGFSYDWSREVDTTDPGYVKWTQWIFLQLFDTWYDAEARRGRPIAELPVPAEVSAGGAAAVRRYQALHRLAYQAEIPVNWCPALGTVLANEEVEDGKSERGGHPVIRTPLRQWLLRITAYAERLLDDLALVDWPESIKKMQRDWIGRSAGADVEFEVFSESGNAAHPRIRVFTTRPDTLFGATYVVLAPEHPLVDEITSREQRSAVSAYKEAAARKSDLERTELAKKKTGVFTGAHAVNPVNGERVPIWVADYVLSSYGTGAIMAVPAHDERDFEFAKQFELPIRPVLLPPQAWFEQTNVYRTLASMEKSWDTGFEVSQPDHRSRDPEEARATLLPGELKILDLARPHWESCRGDRGKVAEELYRRHIDLFAAAFTAEANAINSGQFDGQDTASFKQAIIAWLEKRGLGRARTNYKLRDWLFSRQRYWGEPFPILHELDDHGQPTGNVFPLSLDELPLTLPELEDYRPTGKPEPPLEKATEWVHVTRNGRHFKRETNTMPQWAGSCWYYLRYLDPGNTAAFCDPAKERHWMPVDLYVGGAEHAVLHLLYSRFWHKVLYDRGYVHTSEPFQRLVNQGMILGEMEFTAFRDNDRWVSATRVDVDEGRDKESGASYERIRVEEKRVEKRGDSFVLSEAPEVRVDARAFKMSKSRGNVINPDEVVGEYGADSMRLYEMFMGPLEATKPWSMRGVEGVYRFLNRVWRLIIDDRAETLKLAESVCEEQPDRDTLRKLHATVRKVSDDVEHMRFNTAIAAMMEYSNHLTGLQKKPRQALEPLVLLLAPFAPHIAEELWSALGHARSLAYEHWPSFDEALTFQEEIEIPVQINGKLRARLTVAAGISKSELESAALADPRVRALLDGKEIQKIIVVPGKLVNIVLK